MKIRLLSLFLALTCLVGVKAQQVMLYSDCNYRGQAVALQPGNYLANQHGMRLRDLSSVQVPAGMAVNLFSSDYFNGQYITLTQSSACLINQNFNDEMVSLQVYRTGGNWLQPNQAPVTIFERCNYGGRSENLFEGTATSIPMGFVRAQSIRVAPGFGVIFQKEVRQGGMATLQNEEYRADKACLTLLWGANVKSAYVYRLGGVYDNYWNNNTNVVNTFNQGAIVYEAANYGGRAQILNPGAYRGYMLDQVGGERVISSLKVFPGYRIIAFTGSNFDGSSIVFTNNISNLSGGPISWNDRISSIIVERVGNTGGGGGVIVNPTYPETNTGNPSMLPQDGVTIFQNPNLSGGKWTAPVGSYRSNQILYIGPGTTQSIHVPYGYRLIAFTGSSLNGSSRVFNSGTYYNLASDAPGWSRAINSMIVERTDGGNVVSPTYPNAGENPASLPQDAVTIFQNPNFSGGKWSAPVGSYRSNQILYIGPGTTQSVYVPYGYRLVAFTGSSLNGSSRVFNSGSYYNLASDAPGWSRAINSMVVERVSDMNQPGSVSGTSGVVVFVDAFYRGSSSLFGMGSVNTQQLGSVFTRSISSIQIPNGWRVVVYDGPNFTGNYRILTYSIDNFGSEGNGQWNDRIMSMVIEPNNGQPVNAPGRPQPGGVVTNEMPSRPQPGVNSGDMVLAYADIGYQGSTQPLPVGSYRGDQLAGTPPRTISSIRIPQGYKVTVYDGPNFNGDYRVLTYSIDNFVSEGGGKWNDRISSIIVERTY